MCSKKYSVIIPHYNSPLKLERLIRSIPERNDIEILVVDDVSKNDYQDLIRNSSLINERAKVIFSQTKLYAGGARNVGLKKASGEWVLFADSDDYYEPDAFVHLDQFLDTHSNQFDVVYFKAKDVGEDGNTINGRALRSNKTLESFNKYSRFENVVPWNKLISRLFLQENAILFDEGVKYSNDIMFATRLAFASDRIGLIDEVIYNLEDNATSLTKQKSIESTYLRRRVQLAQERLLFEKLPAEYRKKRRYTYYRKYLRDPIIYRDDRFKKLRSEYESVAQIRPLDTFKWRYYAYWFATLVLIKLKLPVSVIGEGPGSF